MSRSSWLVLLVGILVLLLFSQGMVSARHLLVYFGIGIPVVVGLAVLVNRGMPAKRQG